MEHSICQASALMHCCTFKKTFFLLIHDGSGSSAACCDRRAVRILNSTSSVQLTLNIQGEIILIIAKRWMIITPCARTGLGTVGDTPPVLGALGRYC
jgi:hypothetical protein